MRDKGTMDEDAAGTVTGLLAQWSQGDEKALAALLPLVYTELHRMAHFQLRRERGEHTLQSTALVHEAYLRLLGNQPKELRNRTHFIAIASRLIRQVLVDTPASEVPPNATAAAVSRLNISMRCRLQATRNYLPWMTP